MSLSSFVLILFGGSVAGFLGALLGIGGGIFLIPYLVLILKIPIHQAIATSIVCVIATSSTAASVNVERRFANVRLGMVLETTTTLGAIIGGFTANALSGALLSKIFGVLLIFVSFLMIWKTREKEGLMESQRDGWIQGQYFDPAISQTVNYTVRRLPAGLSVSFIAGNLSGLLGIGGGILKVPAMNLFCSVPMKAATSTSNLMIGVTAVASAFIYYAHDKIHPVITSAAIVGVLIGSLAGTAISARIRGRTIMYLFTAVLLFLAIEMFLR